MLGITDAGILPLRKTKLGGLDDVTVSIGGDSDEEGESVGEWD